MAKTPSNMLPLGTSAPDFELLDPVDNNTKTLAELKSDTATVIMFICNHCPFVLHILDNLLDTIRNYQKKGISFIAICSNDENAYPADGPEKMAELAREKHFTFPYLHDATQTVAKAFDAACTPDFYIFDSGLKCVYRGRYDAATPGNDVSVTGSELTAALDAILEGEPVNSEQHPSVGCNIKWK